MKNDLLKPFFVRNKPFTTREFSRFHSLSRPRTASALSRFVAQKHLLHLKRGVYLPISHKGLTPEESFSDPFVVIPTVFPMSYIGGWSMASHWGLTEQLFQSVSVLSEKAVHVSEKHIGRYQFFLFKAPLPFALGVDSIWIEGQQIPVSNVHRTMVDMIENPRCAGGIQNVIDCAKIYFKEFYSFEVFTSYATSVKKGVFFKRLGYLIEMFFDIDHPLCVLAKSRITKGASPIDSHIKCEKLITRWNLFINEGLDI